MSKRMFVAIQAPPSWREAATAVQDHLRDALPSDRRRLLRHVDPELMHVTVRFLGDIDDAAVEALDAALAAHAPPVDLTLALGAPGSFGAPARTSVIWMALDGDLDALHALAARVEAGVRAAGLPGDDRALSPHLTLARVRREAGSADRRVIAEALAAAPAPSTAATRTAVPELVLVHSHLGGRQPYYETAARYPDARAAS